MLHSENRPLRHDENTVLERDLDSPFGTYAPTLLQRFLIAIGRNSFLSRGKLRYLLSQVIFSVQRPLDIERFGSSFRIGLHSNLIDYGLLLNANYNQDDIRFLAEGLGPQSVCLDIGCNIGLYALQLANTGAKVLAIDANPAMVETLRFNAKSSPATSLEIIHAAVSDSEGRADLAIHNDDVAIVGLVESAEGSLVTRPLTSILAEFGIEKIDALKIDIEGFEDKALAPFLNTAEDSLLPRKIVIERVGVADYPGCVAAFEKRGYQLVGASKQNSFYELKG